MAEFVKEVKAQGYSTEGLTFKEMDEILENLRIDATEQSPESSVDKAHTESSRKIIRERKLMIDEKIYLILVKGGPDQTIEILTSKGRITASALDLIQPESFADLKKRLIVQDKNTFLSCTVYPWYEY